MSIIKMTVIPINDPGARFDFKYEAMKCAINEACDGAAECNIVTPCPFCQALAHQIELALLRAFVCGQASILTSTPLALDAAPKEGV